MTALSGPISAQVVGKRLEAEGVVSLELRSSRFDTLDAPTAGAHIDVHLPCGITRQYSLVRWSGASLTIAVKREPASRGGSKFLVEELQVGQTLDVGAIRNAFPLDPGAHPSVLIGGGIGITPLVAMVDQLVQLNRNWTLYYASPSSATAAFADQLRAHGSRVSFSFDQGRRFDFRRIVEEHGPGAHYYACGPQSLMESFQSALQHIPAPHIHLEHFGAVGPREGDGQFVIELAKSGRVIPVGADQTILDALCANGVDLPNSCQQGICGQCEVRVVSGVPDHRDQVLDAAEKESNETIMVCCSRSHSPVLVLDC